MNECLIWNPETGITDIDGDPDELSASDIPGIKAVWKDQKERMQGSAELSEFTERLSREWAIETGVIENLYDIERGVTQTLIEQGFQEGILDHGPTNKPRDYVIKLLRDQKEALEGVFDFVKNERTLSTSYIKELHAALLRSQESTEGIDSQGRHVGNIPLIKGDWKAQPNYPVRNNVTYKYCPPEQVASEMDRLIEMHESHVARNVPSEVQAAWLHHRFSQVHPFQDGNGRIARAMASLVLVKDELFPLVVRRDDKPDYLDALEAADKGDLKPLVDLITKLQIAQYRKATAISETLMEEDEQAAMAVLSKAADKIEKERLERFKDVFSHARALEEDLKKRLKAISSGLKSNLQKVSSDADVYLNHSNEENDYYFRSQIIENARKHLGYFADTSEHRSWISLGMRWSRRAQLVFTIHGIGKPFNGSLICAPFLEIRDTDGEDVNGKDETQATLFPVAEEGFVFFYNEDEKRLIERFTPWRKKVVTTAIKELTRNL